jgi:crossover junction endodeoxyribonuclease RuvC
MIRVVLGVDPSISSTGWAVLKVTNGGGVEYVDSGIIKTDPKLEHIERYSIIFHSIKNIANLHKPNIVGVEEIFVNSNSLSSLKLATARGVIMAALIDTGCNIKEYSPAFIKKTITGSGSADKTQVHKMLQMLLPQIANTKFSSADQTDAIAIALTTNIIN